MRRRIGHRAITALCAAAVWLCAGIGAAAQYVKKETVDNITGNVAVVYADGMPEGAIWPLGTVLTRNGATIRHQVDKGNGGNIDVNSRVSARFIVAPADVSNAIYWQNASGFDNGNNDINAEFTNTAAKTGCRGLTTGNRSWRLPTQRELQLIWLLKEGINKIYSANMMNNSLYWSATEEDAGNVWVVNFGNVLEVKPLPKSRSYRARCVSDY